MPRAFWIIKFRSPLYSWGHWSPGRGGSLWGRTDSQGQSWVSDVLRWGTEMARVCSLWERRLQDLRSGVTGAEKGSAQEWVM